ncbi:hypothetical protein T484DRAFT_1977272 [Baffinella frigidus]|nr:hypothetical protein T484DRAFT_1977272 [Cryptophyta sp. CCMP2293]
MPLEETASRCRFSYEALEMKPQPPLSETVEMQTHPRCSPLDPPDASADPLPNCPPPRPHQRLLHQCPPPPPRAGQSVRAVRVARSHHPA